MRWWVFATHADAVEAEAAVPISPDRNLATNVLVVDVTTSWAEIVDLIDGRSAFPAPSGTAPAGAIEVDGEDIASLLPME